MDIEIPDRLQEAVKSVVTTFRSQPKSFDELQNYDYNLIVGENKETIGDILIDFQGKDKSVIGEFIGFINGFQIIDPSPYKTLPQSHQGPRNYYFLLKHLQTALEPYSELSMIHDLVDTKLADLESHFGYYREILEEYGDLVELAQSLVNFIQNDISLSKFILTELYRGILMLIDFCDLDFKIDLIDMEVENFDPSKYPIYLRSTFYAFILGGVCAKFEQHGSIDRSIASTVPISLTGGGVDADICIRCHTIYERQVPNLDMGSPDYYKLKKIAHKLGLIETANIVGLDHTNLEIDYELTELTTITPRHLLQRLLYKIKLPTDMKVKINIELDVPIDGQISEYLDVSSGVFVETIMICRYFDLFENFMQLENWNSHLKMIQNPRLIDLLGSGNKKHTDYLPIFDDLNPDEQRVVILYAGTDDFCRSLIKKKDLDWQLYDAAIKKLNNTRGLEVRFFELIKLYAGFELHLTTTSFKKALQQVTDNQQLKQIAMNLPYSDINNYYRVTVILNKIRDLETLKELKEYHSERELLIEIENRIEEIQ